MTNVLRNFSHANIGNNASLSPASPQLSAQGVFVIALLAVVILVSVVGNVVVLCVLCRHRRANSITNALVATLSVSDLLLTFTSVFACVVVLASRAPHGVAYSACILVATINGVFGGLSTAVVCMIAADRYYAVVTLHRRRFTKATMCNAIAAVTVVVSVVYFPWRPDVNADCLNSFGATNTDHPVALVARVLFYVTTCAVEIFFCIQFFKVCRMRCIAKFRTFNRANEYSLPRHFFY